jgi:hypothetical protein
LFKKCKNNLIWLQKINSEPPATTKMNDIDQRMVGRMDGHTNKSIDGRMDGRTYKRTHPQPAGRMDVHHKYKQPTGCCCCPHQDNSSRMPPLSTARQCITLWHIVAMHQSSAATDLPCLSLYSIDITTLMDRKQRCTTRHAILVETRMSLLSFLQSISVRLLQVCEITFFLKTCLSIMMTRAEINYALRFWLCHIL